MGGRCGQFQLLCAAGEGLPAFDDLFFGGLAGEAAEHSGKVTVCDRHPQALGGEGRALRRHNHTVFDLTPDFQRLLLRFLLFATDIGDDVVHHFGPTLKGLAGSGNGLVGAHEHLFNTELVQREEGGHVALQRAVGFNGDEATFGAQAFALIGDNLLMMGIEFRNNHRHVRGATMGAVVGNDRAFRLGIRLFQRADIGFRHVDGAEDKVDQRSDLFHLSGIQNGHGFHAFRDGGVHSPTAGNRFFIRFARGAGTGRQCGDGKPGVPVQQGHETLSHHAGASYDTYAILFTHDTISFFTAKNGTAAAKAQKTVEKPPSVVYNKRVYGRL